MNYLIGIDIGGTVIKVGLYDEKGNEIGVKAKNEPLLTPELTYCERNMESLWLSICEQLKALIYDTQIDVKCVKGIGFCAHGKGLYLIDKAGNPVRNGIISSDTRANLLAQTRFKSASYDQVYLSSYQQLWPSHPAILLEWLKKNEPDNYAKIDTVFMAHDYIRFKLTGEKTAEITNIAGSNLVNQISGEYDPNLFAFFEIEDIRSKLPPIIRSTELSGYVTQASADLSGLQVGTAVYGGVFDVVAASLVSGVLDETILSTVLGTWSITTSVMDTIKFDPSYPFIWGNYPSTGKFYVHEGSPTSASNLDWILKTFFHGDAANYAQFETWMSQYITKPDTDILFMPYLFASNTIHPLPGTLFGLSAKHEMRDIIQAVYHGIVSSHLIHHKRIISINPKINLVRLTGGPSQSQAWIQMFCDAFRLPIEVVDVQQAGCKGAAMCAAVGSGLYADLNEAQQNMLGQFKHYEPRIELFGYYDEHFEKFNRLTQALLQG